MSHAKIMYPCQLCVYLRARWPTLTCAKYKVPCKEAFRTCKSRDFTPHFRHIKNIKFE
jgi:hypothetical protein